MNTKLIIIALIVTAYAVTISLSHDVMTSQKTVQIEQETLPKSTPLTIDEAPKQSTQVPEFELAEPLTPNGVSNVTVKRTRIIDQLSSRFRLLESQYGLLSIDDIQALEASLNDIESNDDLLSLSGAIDELLLDN